MSRHRNIRNNQDYYYDEDDYYDDDYYEDDYYDDEEEDETTAQYRYENKKQTTPPNNNQMKKATTTTANNHNSKPAASLSQYHHVKAGTANSSPQAPPPPGGGGGNFSLPAGFNVTHAKPKAGPRIVTADSSNHTKRNTNTNAEPSSATKISVTLPGKAITTSIGSDTTGSGVVSISSPKNKNTNKRNANRSKSSSPVPFSVGSKPGANGGNQSSNNSRKDKLVISPPPSRSASKSPVPTTARAGGGTTTSSTGSLQSNATSNGGASSKVPSTPPPLSKEVLDAIVTQEKPRLSMVVLGHVDAGKSTLMGQVLVQLSKVNQRTVLKYQKQAAEIGKASFALAWIMDEDESERERGVTMDVATKTIRTPRYDVTVLDAPGHKDFIPQTITGAANADVGLLVVAATTGEFESGFHEDNQQRGQTREHILLSRGLGVSQLLVAVNKLDATNWDQHRFEQIQARLLPFLINCGYKAERIRFVPVSGLTGENIVHRKEKALTSWYNNENKSEAVPPTSPTLMEALDMFQPPQRNLEKPLRWIVSDAYIEGRGITVRGRIVQGYVRTGEPVCVMPLGDVATVARIEHGDLIGGPSTTEKDDAAAAASSSIAIPSRHTLAKAGDIIDASLQGIADIARITRGCVLCNVAPSHRKVPLARKFNAKLLVMDHIDVPIIKGAQVTFHMQSVDVPATISKLLEIIVPSPSSSHHHKTSTAVATSGSSSVASSSIGSTGGGGGGATSLPGNATSSKRRPRIITGGTTALVGITLSERLCIEEFTSCRALGRFVLRRKGDTIAVGLIDELFS